MNVRYNKSVLDTLIHRWFRIPYTLHVRHNKKPKKPRQTVLFIHGIGNSGDSWNEIVQQLPSDVHVITIDLLGFGSSPRPEWATYNAKTQARAVLATLFKLRIIRPVVIVGHSLGSLVAVEVARRYPQLVRSLVLCSPPFYDVSESGKMLPKSDKVLRQLYETASKRPDQFARLTTFATKYKLVNQTFNVTKDNIETFIAALRSTIINQTAYQDIRKLRRPVHIVRGRFDPFIVPKNLRALAAEHDHITLTTVSAGHEIRGRLVDAVAQVILNDIDTKRTS